MRPAYATYRTDTTAAQKAYRTAITNAKKALQTALGADPGSLLAADRCYC